MKILLLSDIPPNTRYPAALFLAGLCQFVPHDSLACFCVVNPQLEASVRPDLDWLPVQFEEKPREATYHIPTPLGMRISKVYNLAWESYVSQVKIPQIAEKAIRFGREQGCDVVWCTLEGQTLIRLARQVADGLGVPLRTQVFDPPFWWLRDHLVNAVSSRRILATFDAALRRSRTCAAGSWAMAEEYRRLYQTNAIPVIPSLRAEVACAAQATLEPDGPFVIGVAGTLYAQQEWQALLNALACAKWQIAGRPVKVLVLGASLTLQANSQQIIEYRGWHAQEDTIQILSQASVLYCPYWFDPVFEHEARLSFPSKLVTYLAAGRPVFFHGPAYASPHRFLAQHEAAVACHSLEPDAILEGLRRLAADADLYAQLAHAGAQAFRTHLTVASMRAAFAQFLEVDEDFLLPVHDHRA